MGAGLGHQGVLHEEGAVWVWNPLSIHEPFGKHLPGLPLRNIPHFGPGAAYPFLPLRHKGGWAQDSSLLHGEFGDGFLAHQCQ